MKKRQGAWTAVLTLCAMAVSMTGELANISAAAKKPAPATKKISVAVKKTKKVAVKYVSSGMKTAIKQGKASKKCVKVQWKKKKHTLVFTGKKAGNCKVKVIFKTAKKKYTSVFTVNVKKEGTKKPEATQAPVIATDPPYETEVPKESISPDETPEPTTEPAAEPFYDPETMPVKDIYEKYFKVGAAINGSSYSTMALHHDGMKNILKKHFNSTVLSNLMKPEHLLDEQASKADPDGMPVCHFDSCDDALQFCMDNGIKMRGHTLVWHNQVPTWFFYKDFDTEKELADAETMEKRLESYIRQVITHCQDNYPGVVYCWDVVNECVCVDANSYVVTSGGWKLRATTLSDNDFTHDTAISNYYYATMGETYVEKAFTYARKYADKDVKLFYNDYNVFLTEKMNNIYLMVSELKEKGLIDGIGLQPTVLMSWPELDSENEGSFRTCLETYAKLGLELQITELSFKMDGKVTDKKLQTQSDRYEEFMSLLLKEDSDNGGNCNITSVTVFGICDDYPLYTDFSQNLYLWDKNCDPKPCLYGFVRPGLLAAMTDF